MIDKTSKKWRVWSTRYPDLVTTENCHGMGLREIEQRSAITKEAWNRIRGDVRLEIDQANTEFSESEEGQEWFCEYLELLYHRISPHEAEISIICRPMKDSASIRVIYGLEEGEPLGNEDAFYYDFPFR